MTQLELREAEIGGGYELVGYASTFNQGYEVGGYTETVKPGAFRRSLGESPDCALLVNHAGTPLARTASGTMTLTEDARGLRFTAELEPTDPDVQALVPKLRRGDITECSFAFRATKQQWSEDRTERLLEEINLHRGDCSLVTTAANPNATASLRAESLPMEARERLVERVGQRCGGGRVPRAPDPTPYPRSRIAAVKVKRARIAEASTSATTTRPSS